MLKSTGLLKETKVWDVRTSNRQTDQSTYTFYNQSQQLGCCNTSSCGITPMSWWLMQLPEQNTWLLCKSIHRCFSWSTRPIANLNTGISRSENVDGNGVLVCVVTPCCCWVTTSSGMQMRINALDYRDNVELLLIPYCSFRSIGAIMESNTPIQRPGSVDCFWVLTLVVIPICCWDNLVPIPTMQSSTLNNSSINDGKRVVTREVFVQLNTL